MFTSVTLSRLSARGLLICAAVSLTLSACGGGGGETTTTPSTPSPADTGTISLRVTDAVSGLPIAGATVASGSISATTDASGTATLSSVAPNTRVVVRASAAGHGDGLESTAVVANTTVSLAIQVVPVATSQTVLAATGGTVSVPGSSAQVVLPADGLVLASGGAYSGTVTVELTPIDPTANPNAMPGEYQASTSSGTAQIESFGALGVKLTGSGGQALNLATGKTATIRIPAASRSATLPATIPLFYFNEVTGLWVQEGTATLVPGITPYYQGTVSHFSYWNADQIASTIRYSGCIKDAAGAAAAGVRVLSDGIDYSGTSSAVTDASGQFVLPIKLNGTATVIGQSNTQLTNTVSVGPLTSDITNTTCLTLSAVNAAFSIKLSWGASPSDLDSHLILPTGEHLYFGHQGSLTQTPFANLDVDDVTSFGPEVITVTRLMVGTYTYWVDNYSGTDAPGITGSPARVEVNLNGTTTIYTPPAGETATTDGWAVMAVDVDAQCRVTQRRLGTWSVSVPAPGQVGTPTYCTP